MVYNIYIYVYISRIGGIDKKYVVFSFLLRIAYEWKLTIVSITKL